MQTDFTESTWFVLLNLQWLHIQNKGQQSSHKCVQSVLFYLYLVIVFVLSLILFISSSYLNLQHIYIYETVIFRFLQIFYGLSVEDL